jgi:RNA 2',3'-cyclic 3'-phosphodiesterase
VCRSRVAGSDIVPKPTDRLFFAIFPDEVVATRIARLAQCLRSEHGLKGKPLEMARFHVTLIHLGDYEGLPQHIVAAAADAAARVAMPPFEVAFDRVKSFPARLGNRPFVLCGHEGVGALMAFQQTLEASLSEAGLGGRAQPQNTPQPQYIPRPQYTPHVTLLYDDRLVAEQPVDRVDWTVREYVFVHSLLGRAVYVPLARWRLST